MTNTIVKLNVIDSTQTYIKRNLNSFTIGDCCYARKQTNGYGRTGNWNSEENNIYFSKLLPNTQSLHLVAICSIHMFVTNYIKDSYIQIPNDLYHNKKKLSGFIIEQYDDYSILGIGININNANHTFTSFNNITNKVYNVDLLTANLNNIINDNLHKSTKALETYYVNNCPIVNKHVSFINLKTNCKASGIVTNLSSTSITIDDVTYHQMEIKLLNKHLY